MVNRISPIFLKDYYKTDHKRQYPDKTEFVYSNLTARTSRMPGVDHVVVFGIQYFINEYLVRRFNAEFFGKDRAAALRAYERRMNTSLGPNQIGTKHLGELHELGYLPLKIKALPEGTVCPIKTPILTITNTDARFYWLTNFLETLMSCVLWHPITAATIAHEYRKLLNDFAERTSDTPDFVQWQGHDFSFRGQASVESATLSGAAHLLSFTGTDTIPAIEFLEREYGANAEKELIGGSVPATEHSVMCLGGKETELETFDRLITKVYPSGIVSIVSDTWDYWKVLAETVPTLKAKILARDGKVVIRPDSGDPAKILCGDLTAAAGSIERKGTVEHLWDIFGGSVNSKGYKQLDPHIGVIYGDSITLERAAQICQGLLEKGFASTNVVFGIGSYTYQYVTRDTFGFAVKATYGQVGGQPCEIFKDPKTDGGTKKSARGLLRVNADLTFKDQCSPSEEDGGALELVFDDGIVHCEETLAGIRARLAAQA